MDTKKLMQDTMNISENKTFRKNLRNNGTPAEATLWKLIKGRQIDGLKFRRQQSVGSYILDFYCPQIKLAIELDGEVHSTAREYDDMRARYLINEKNIWVIRFENRVVFENPSQIVEGIREMARKRGLPTTPPFGHPSFQKEGSGDSFDSSFTSNGDSFGSSVCSIEDSLDSSTTSKRESLGSSITSNRDSLNSSTTSNKDSLGSSVCSIGDSLDSSTTSKRESLGLSIISNGDSIIINLNHY